MDRYQHEGLTFAVAEAGPADGPVVVLLHGFPQTSASWDGVVPGLVGAGLRVLAPDQRGYSPGARPRGRAAYATPRLAGDVRALADAAGAARVHLVGHDWGAVPAWHLAATDPDRVASLTVLATPHPRAMAGSLWRSSQLLRSWYMVLFQLPAVPEKALSAGGEAAFSRALERSGLPPGWAGRYWATLSQPGALTGAVNWYRGIPFSRPMAGPVPVPTTYAWGSGDRFLSRAAAEATARYVTGPYRFEALDGVSHWIPEQVPDTVTDLVLDRVSSAT